MIERRIDIRSLIEIGKGESDHLKWFTRHLQSSRHQMADQEIDDDWRWLRARLAGSRQEMLQLLIKAQQRGLDAFLLVLLDI